VAAIGRNDRGQCNVQDWTDITAISAGTFHTLALRSDGTVAAVGWNGERMNQCEVSHWKDVAAISAGSYHSVVLHKNGKVSARGWNQYGQCRVQTWERSPPFPPVLIIPWL
jgi:alpha-tubulin suppressor-like RCC1 family protein